MIYNMNKFAPFPYLLLFLLSGVSAWSQDCTANAFLQQGKTIEVSLFSKKGEPNGRNVYTVSSVSNSGGIVTSTISTQSFDRKERPTATSSNTIKCTGGTVQVDMRMLLPEGPPSRFANAPVNGNGGFLEYPSGMKSGDTLKSANMVCSNYNNPSGGPPGVPPGPPPPPNPFGGGSTLTMWVYDRKVLGQETISTNGGSWNCIKISYKEKLSFKAGPFPTNLNIEGTEWYAPGVGIVKTQTDHNSTAITSVK
jgi:hypothetical protein